jgi:WD40 repeat protein
VTWDIDTSEETWRTPVASPMHGLAAGVVGDRRVLVCAHDDGTLVVWDLATKQVTRDLNVDGSRLRAVAFAGDNRIAVVGGTSGGIPSSTCGREWSGSRSTSMLVRSGRSPCTSPGEGSRSWSERTTASGPGP